MKVIADDQWVCVDCLFVIANGDTGGIESEGRAAEVLASVYERQASGEGRWVCEGPHTGEHGIECRSCDGSGQIGWDHDDHDWTPASPETKACDSCSGTGRIDESEAADTQDFSWCACACCGSTLGGSRHRCALIGEGS